MKIIIDNYYLEKVTPFLLLILIHNNEEDYELITLHPYIKSKKYNYDNNIENIYKNLRKIQISYIKNNNMNIGNLVKTNDDENIFSNIKINGVKIINTSYFNIENVRRNKIDTLSDLCYGLLGNILIYNEYNDNKTFSTYFHYEKYSSLFKIQRELLKNKNDLIIFLREIFNILIFQIYDKIDDNKLNYNHEKLQIINTKYKNKNIKRTNYNSKDLEKNIMKSYNYDDIICEYFSNTTKTNIIEEYEDGFCFGINMMVKYYGNYINLEKYFSNVGTMREMVDLSKYDFINIGFNPIMNMKGAEYNIIIPIFINKIHFKLSEYYLKWIFNLLKLEVKEIFTLLYDATILFVNNVINNNYQNINDVKYYFMFWITCNRIYVKNKYNIKKYIFTEKSNDLNNICGQIISNGFKDKYDEIKKLFEINERFEDLKKVNILFNTFGKINLDNFILDLIREHSILDEDICKKILLIMEKQKN